MDDKALKLLLVEDSEDDEFLLLRHLRKNDFAVNHKRVQTAEDVKSALLEEQWDIIISDYSMPGFTGVEVLAIVNEYCPDIPFIMVSGAIGEERAAQVMKAGASDYVTKGNFARLIPAIERELREYAQRMAGRAAEAEIYKLSAALAQSASLIMIFDAEGKIDYVNETFLRTTGYVRDEVIGKTDDFMYLGEVPDEVYATVWRDVKSGKEWRGELPKKKKNGDLFWVYSTFSSIRDDSGNITQYLAVQEDVTERKELEAELQRYTESLQEMVEDRTEQLRLAKEQMEAILENSSDGIVLALSSGDILTSNPAFQQLFNGNVKRSIEELVHLMPTETDTKSFAEALISVLYDKNAERTQTSFITDNGNTIDLDLAFAPVQTESGKVEAVVLSVRDITLVKDLERFKTQFIANAAHDLANPIAALKMRLHLMKSSPDEMDRHVGILERQIDRMERLVDELRLLSQFDRGIIQLEKRDINLHMLVAQIIEVYKPVADEKNITISFNKPDNLSRVSLDPESFDRVIVNLVSNAINYTMNDGTVLIRLFETEDTCVLEVEDTGIGIEDDSQMKIFERFYRTARAQKENNRGTGLGLAIVREIVEAHDGTIQVKSKLDEGTTFTVTLPR